MFTQQFDRFVCADDSIECEKDGFTFTAKIFHDSDKHIDDDDTHNLKYFGKEQEVRVEASRKAWDKNEWFYCGVVISATFNGVYIDDNLASSWGMEANYPQSNNNHLFDVANELLSEAATEAEAIKDDLLTKLKG